MVNIAQRVRAALDVFQHGYPSRRLRPEEVKANGDRTALWPDNTEDVEWQLTDFKTYLEEGYELNSLVYSAVMYKVRATATAPLRAYTGTPEDPEMVQIDHDTMLKIKDPNPNESWVDFHARNMIYFNIAGNVYIYRDPSTGHLYSLRPDRVYIVPEPESQDAEPNPARGLLGYYYTKTGSYQNGYPILPENLYHIRLPGASSDLEGFGYGMPHLGPAARSVDVDNTVTKYLNLFFESGAMVTGLLSFDVPLKEDTADTIMERWVEKYGGYDKWKVGVLDRGGKYERVSLTFEEMGFEGIDSRSESRALGPFGVPPILIGAKIGLDRSTYSNYEAAREAVWEDTLVPELTWFEHGYGKIFDTSEVFVMFDYRKVPAMHRNKVRQINAAYSLWQMGVPRDRALHEAGLELPSTPGGDQSIVPTGRGVQQGARSDIEEESWGRQ
jgi:HK97 family phage portal protein